MSTKRKVYDYLSEHKSEYISGSFMAGELGISRNAVWKAIKALEKEGVKIDAISNKGYCLVDRKSVV